MTRNLKKKSQNIKRAGLDRFRRRKNNKIQYPIHKGKYLNI